MLPRGNLGRISVVLLGGLAALYELGAAGARIGPFLCPEIGAGWLIGATAAAFLFVPRRSCPLRLGRAIGCGALLLLLALVLVGYRERAFTPIVIPGSIHRLSELGSRPERTVDVGGLHVEGRYLLKRLAGRRRDVGLESKLFLVVPHRGIHRFEVACDDACFVEVDGRTIVPRSSGAAAQTFLEPGVHGLVLGYEQRGGPAYLKIDWDRPAFFELLSLDHYLALKPNAKAGDAVLERESRGLLLLCLWLAWWCTAFSLAVSAGEAAPRSSPAALGVVFVTFATLVYQNNTDALGTTGVDDANIYFNYAKKFLAHGEFTWNLGGERVEGFTSMLWELTCIAVFYCFAEPEQALAWLNLIVVGFALAIFVYVVADGITARDSGERQDPGGKGRTTARALLGSAMLGWFFAEPHFFIWTCLSLMEAGLWTSVQLLACSALVIYQRGDSQSGRAMLCASVTGLVLTRPEGLAFGATLVALVAASELKRTAPRLSKLLPPLGCFAASVVLLYGLRHLYFGYWFPNTVYAKVGPLSYAQLQAGAHYLASYVEAHPVVLAALALGVGKLAWLGFRLVTEPRRAEWSLGDLSVSASVFLLLGTAIIVICGGDHMRGWRFFQPYWGYVLVIVADAIWRLGAAVGRLRNAPPWLSGQPVRLAAPSVLLVSALIYVENPTRWNELSIAGSSNEFYLADLGRRVGGDLNLIFEGQNLPSVGVITAGGVGFTYRGWTVDLMGLNNVTMAHESRDRAGDKNHAIFDREIFYRQLPDVVLPVDPYAAASEARLKFTQLALEYRLLKGLPDDPAFRELYVPVAVRSEVEPVATVLCLFMKKSFLAEPVRKSRVVHFTYEEVP